MPSLDLLDNITTGHILNASPSRSPPTTLTDGHVSPNRPSSSAPAATTTTSFSRPPPSVLPTYQSATRVPAEHRRVRLKAVVHWLGLVWLDVGFVIVVLAATGAALRWGYDVFRWDRRWFAMVWDPMSETWYGPPELSYPRSNFILSILFTSFIIPAVPMMVIVLMQIWVRDFWDANAALFGLWKGLVMMTFIQIIFKKFREFRPHFITICRPWYYGGQPLPDMNSASPFRIYVTPSVCRIDPNGPTDAVLSAMQSFPSGHTSESFLVGTFLALYLNAKLKAFSDYHTSFWKMFAIISPLFGSILVAGTLIVDRNHHVHDILLSIPIGVFIALLSYRCHYASIFDYRTNHLPLPWSRSRQSLRPTVPEAETKHGENLAAVAWPRRPMEHKFSKEQERGTTLGLDGASDQVRNHRDRVRNPGDIHRGRLRQNVFQLQEGLDSNITGAVVPDGQGGMELNEVVEPSVEDAAARPSFSFATGRSVDLEGQRREQHQRRTVYSSADART